ncbi:MAG: hypothetical protein ACRDPS_08155 [Nocardioides sp.]|uniref:hypothetical protein n=1 Tax=Nocardioides sp. TaxID=35761 RepID=UPI003D6B5BE7
MTAILDQMSWDRFNDVATLVLTSLAVLAAAATLVVTAGWHDPVHRRVARLNALRELITSLENAEQRAPLADLYDRRVEALGRGLQPTWLVTLTWSLGALGIAGFFRGLDHRSAVGPPTTSATLLDLGPPIVGGFMMMVCGAMLSNRVQEHLAASNIGKDRTEDRLDIAGDFFVEVWTSPLRSGSIQSRINAWTTRAWMASTLPLFAACMRFGSDLLVFALLWVFNTAALPVMVPGLALAEAATKSALRRGAVTSWQHLQRWIRHAIRRRAR